MKKFLLFLGITAFVLISLIALDCCNQADNQLPNNNQIQTDNPLQNGPATVTPIVTLSCQVPFVELEDVGSIMFRTDLSSGDYIKENLIVGTTYEATISTFLESDYYITAVYVNGALIATNNDANVSMFTCAITATKNLEITLECLSKPLISDASNLTFKVKKIVVGKQISNPTITPSEVAFVG